MIYIYYQGDRVPKVPRNVTSVIVHHSVTSIEAFAFEGCKNLVFIYIPTSVKKIGVCAFRGCFKIMAIHLPPTLNFIGLRAFKDCKQLVTLELPPPKVMPRLGDSLFQGCISLDKTSKMKDRDFSSWLRRRFDNLPLHRICFRTNVTVKAIKKCIKEKPFSARDRDKLNMTPLHVLVSNRSATPNMVKELLDIYPDAIFCKNSSGSLPIHLACTNPNATLHGFIKELVERPFESGEYPSSTIDLNQNIPTVQAIENDLEFRVQRFLYSCEPVQLSSLKGKKRLDQMKKLERQYMMDMIDSPPSSLHFFQPVKQHGWVTFVKNLSDRKTIETCVDFIDDSTKCPNNVAEALGYAKNHNHRQAINLAIPEIRHALQRRVLFLSRYDLTKGAPVHKSDMTLITRAIDKNADVQYKERILDFIAKSKKNKVVDKRTFQEVLSQTDSRLFSKSFFKDNFQTKKTSNHSKMTVKEILEFVAVCKRQSAVPHQEEVIIKLMREEDKYKKEVIMREFHKLDPAFVISVIRKYNVFVARTAPEPSVNENFRLGKYKYALVMPLADRDLDAICFSENLDTETVRSYARDVALAIQHIHSKRIMHGNLNMKHIVRFGGKLRLCDLSACGRISDDDDDPTSYVGINISSAIVPPEMVYKLKSKEEYDRYLMHFKGTSSFERFQPLKCQRGGGDYFILKCLLMNNIFQSETKKSFFGNKEDDINYIKRSLPYQPMKSNEQIDLWAFGLILYTMVTRKSLFPMNRNFSILNGDVMCDLYSWNDTKKNEALDSIQNVDIKNLLAMLLSPNPWTRPKSIDEVLNHIFLNPSLDRHSLTATLYEDVLSRIDAESLKSEQLFPKSSSFVCGKVFSSTKIATPTAFILLPYSSIELRKYPKSVEKYMIFVMSLVSTMKDPSDFGKLFIRQKVTDPVYYLYLIDEYMCEPAIPSGPYPIAIDSDSLYFKCCLPLMFVALRTMAFENDAASVAKLFFPSLLRPQDGTLDKINELLRHKVSSCVEDSIEERSMQTHGPDELRHFSQYLLERDPNLTFSGLKKVSDRNSRSLWVSESSLNVIKSEDDNSGGLKSIDRAGSNSPRSTNIFF